MLLCFFFSGVLILPIFYGVNGIEKEGSTTKMLPGNVTSDKNNKTKIFASEGGAIMSITPAKNFLSEDNQTILMPSDTTSGVNKIKARKGATEDDNDILNDEYLHKNVDKNTHMLNNTKVFDNSSSSSPPTAKVKVTKPPIVSVEAIAKADQMNSDPAVDGDDRNVKIHKITSIGHPGMVMPIVITILVVPMFAVIGYMALKRGREAWKNRHYKRMDFLLDGMYND